MLTLIATDRRSKETKDTTLKMSHQGHPLVIRQVESEGEIQAYHLRINRDNYII